MIGQKITGRKRQRIERQRMGRNKMTRLVSLKKNAGTRLGVVSVTYPCQQTRQCGFRFTDDDKICAGLAQRPGREGGHMRAGKTDTCPRLSLDCDRDLNVALERGGGCQDDDQVRADALYTGHGPLNGQLLRHGVQNEGSGAILSDTGGQLCKPRLRPDFPIDRTPPAPEDLFHVELAAAVRRV